MKKITGKYLAIGAWLIAAISLYLYVKNIISLNGDSYFSIPYIIDIILIVALQCILGFAIYRERNDRFTVVCVLLYCFVNILFPVIKSIGHLTYIIFTLIPHCVLIIGLFARRKSENALVITKIWFVPAIVQLICSIINAGNFGNIIWPVVNVANFLILGYWLWSYLNVKNKTARENEAKDSKIAYLDDLLSRSIITKEEYDKKIKEIEGK